MKNTLKQGGNNNRRATKKQLQKQTVAPEQARENKIIPPDASRAKMNAQTLWRTMRQVLPDFSLADAKEMVAQDAARHRVKAEYGRFFDKVAALLLRHDPEDIGYGRASTYKLEAGILIPRLPSCRSTKDVRRIIRETFASCFAGYVKPEKHYTNIATEIWALWGKFNRPQS